jgi:hypothetical protein
MEAIISLPDTNIKELENWAQVTHDHLSL